MAKSNYIELKENVETTIYEGLLKLGYHENESFSIYYDLDLLNHLLKTDIKDVHTMKEYLKDFANYMNEYIPGFSYALLKNNRFRFTVLKEGIIAIQENNKENTFLKNLITLVNTHKFTIDDIENVFKSTGKEYVLETTDNPEFNYIIYFKDKSFDKFIYCFSFDELGAFYHRLLEFSFKQSLSEDHHH